MVIVGANWSDAATGGRKGQLSQFSVAVYDPRTGLYHAAGRVGTGYGFAKVKDINEKLRDNLEPRDDRVSPVGGLQEDGTPHANRTSCPSADFKRTASAYAPQRCRNQRKPQVRPRQPARVAREILEPQDGQPARPHHQRHCQVRRPRDQVRGGPDLARVPRRRVHVPLPARREDQGRQGLRRHLHAGPDASGREGAARRDGEAGRVVEEPQAQGAQTGSRGRQSGRAGGPGRAGSGRRRVDGGENFPRRRVRGADRRAERRARLRRDPRVGRDARRRGDGRGA